MGAPINNLLSLIGGISDISTNAKKQKLYDQEIEKNQQSNEASTMALNAAKDLDNQKRIVGSPLGEALKGSYGAALSTYEAQNKDLVEDPSYQKARLAINSILENPNTTAFQAEQVMDKNPLFAALKDTTDRKIQAEAMAAKANIFGENQKNTLADRVAQEFENHPAIKKAMAQKNQIDIDLHTIDSGAKLTPSVYAELEKGIANALSGGAGSSLGAQQRVEMQSLARKAAEISQRVTGNPTEVDTPEYKQFLRDSLNRLKGSYEVNLYNTAQRVAKTKGGIYKGNPQAQQALNQAVEQFKPVSESDFAAPGSQNTSQQDAIAEARRRGLIK